MRASSFYDLARGGVLVGMNQDNAIRFHAILPDKKDATVRPVLERMNSNMEARGDSVKICYSDNKCCGAGAAMLVEAIPSLGLSAGYYPALDSEINSPRRNIPFFTIGEGNEYVYVINNNMVDNFVGHIVETLNALSRRGIERILFVDLEWPSKNPHRRKAAVLSLAVPGASTTTYIFHLARLTSQFCQFASPFPPKLKQVLQDANILKV
jgi:hypothetical protein